MEHKAARTLTRSLLHDILRSTLDYCIPALLTSGYLLQDKGCYLKTVAKTARLQPRDSRAPSPGRNFRVPCLGSAEPPPPAPGTAARLHAVRAKHGERAGPRGAAEGAAGRTDGQRNREEEKGEGGRGSRRGSPSCCGTGGAA